MEIIIPWLVLTFVVAFSAQIVKLAAVKIWNIDKIAIAFLSAKFDDKRHCASPLFHDKNTQANLNY